MAKLFLHKALVTYIAVLFVVKFGVTLCSIRNQTFRRVTGYGMLPLTGTWMNVNKARCALKCLSLYHYGNCSCFTFDKSTSKCMLGTWLHEALPAPGGSDVIYATNGSICHSSNLDLHLYTYNNFTGCVTPPFVGYANWHQAVATCKDNGLRLYYPQNWNKLQIALQLFAQVSNDFTSIRMLWVDLNDIASEGVWLHENGEAPGAILWSDGSPDNWENGENCGAIWTESATAAHVNDVFCDQPYNYVCEIRRDVQPHN